MEDAVIKAGKEFKMKTRHIIGRIANNEYVYSVVTKVIGVVIGLLYSILYSRYLGPELRGEASVITSVSAIVSLIMCLGIYQAYPYFRKKYDGEKRELYIEYINKCLGLFLLYFICAGFFLIFPFSEGRKVSAVLIPFLVATKLLNYAVLIEKPKKRNTAGVYLYVIDIVIVVILLVSTTANLTLCYGFLIVREVIYFIVAFWNLELKMADIRPSLKGIWPYIKYGWIPMLTVVLMEVNYRVDVVMLDGKVSSADIGVYSLGVQLAERLWLVPDALKDILLSKLTKNKGKEEVAKVTRISLGVMLICVVLAALFGRFFIETLYSEEYSDAYEIMLVILVSVISMVFYKMIYSYNVANGNRLVNLKLLGMAALVNVVLNYLLIPRMGTMGAALASLISYSLCGLTFLAFFVRTTGIPIKDMLFMKKEDYVQISNILTGNNESK